jgi:predicted metal-binding protein
MHYQAQGYYPHQFEWGLPHGRWQGYQKKSGAQYVEECVGARAEEWKAYSEMGVQEMQCIWEMTAGCVTAALG